MAVPVGTIDDGTIRLYLLGEAGDLQQQQVEELLLVDETVRRQIAMVEDELIEEYLAGELTPGERASFELHFLMPQSRRENLRFSQALRQYIEKHPEAAVAEPHRRWSLWWPRVAVAAAAVAIAAVGWVGFSRRTPGSASPAQQANRNPTPLAAAPQTVVLTLTPGLLRSGGQEAVLRTRPAADAVEVHLQLPQEASGFATYSAKLATVEGNEVWSQAGLKGEGNNVNLTIPTSHLTRGDWRVVLFGVSSTGKSSDVASYYFRVLFE